MRIAKQLCKCPPAMAVRVLSANAWGSSAFSLTVSINDAITAQFSAPGVVTGRESVLPVQRDGPDGAYDGVVNGHADFGASISAPVSICHVKQVLRDRGVGVRRSGQAD